MAEWINRARAVLVGQRSREAGWGYRPGGRAFAEPTALGGLALLAPTPSQAVDPQAWEAADWLAKLQRPDGAIPLAAEISSPCWSTPYAILLWAALGDYQTQCQRAAQWLLGFAGETWPADAAGAVAHDASIPGWPWVEGTHSWLEPTAMAVLALARQGMHGQLRTRQGVRLICDRAIPSGGWNYGNRQVFGTPLRAQPAPTGISLVALAAAEAGDGDRQRGCQYLHHTLPRVRAPQSLAWGLLGLEACAERPAAADAWLAESFASIERHAATPCELALLVLAGSGRASQLLGIGA